eukprot:229453-Rhodomonas_salina.1
MLASHPESPRRRLNCKTHIASVARACGHTALHMLACIPACQHACHTGARSARGNASTRMRRWLLARKTSKKKRGDSCTRGVKLTTDLTSITNTSPRVLSTCLAPRSPPPSAPRGLQGKARERRGEERSGEEMPGGEERREREKKGEGRRSVRVTGESCGRAPRCRALLQRAQADRRPTASRCQTHPRRCQCAGAWS